MTEARSAKLQSHRLVDDCVVREGDGITARCICGWESRGHVTSLGASGAFQDHKDAATRVENKD
jgi:hypothetical protein